MSDGFWFGTDEGSVGSGDVAGGGLFSFVQIPSALPFISFGLVSASFSLALDDDESVFVGVAEPFFGVDGFLLLDEADLGLVTTVSAAGGGSNCVDG